MSVVDEASLPPYVDFYRDWEDKPLRELNDFVFFARNSSRDVRPPLPSLLCFPGL